ncbi:hypothetical protein ASF87_00175 [Microbacterium sp. Leaf161]|nr:hypothetical protein ASF87_00175 [Microbacterium sp. Leaf161]
MRSVQDVLNPGVVLAFSPHFDDAVFSAGGLLSAAGRLDSFTVITIFGGQPPSEISATASAYHGTWGDLDSMVEVRRAEDRAAIQLLGGQHEHWDELDAIYRRQDDGRWLITEATPTNHPTVHAASERLLLQRIVARIRRRLSEYEGGVVLAPASIGGHVDHARARDAVLEAVGADGRETWSVLLWNDLPYATHYDDAPPLLPPKYAVGPSFGVTIERDDWIRRIAASATYSSQLKGMEWDGVSVPEQIDRWATQRGRRNPLETFRVAEISGRRGAWKRS